MRTITLTLDYDARQKLHSLPFQETLPATEEDVYLRLLPQAEGVFETRGMAAVMKTYISTRDIQRALWAATSFLPKAKDGVVGLMLPGTLYEVSCGEGTGLSKHPAYFFSTGGNLPLGFRAVSVTVTIRYLLLPSWMMPRLASVYSEQGVRIAGVEIIEPTD
ncbi:MAG: hypothetical protein ABTQ25_09050 [Nitrosomonas ureae]